MGRKKLIRFAENKDEPLMLQAEKPLYHQIKGKWNELFFQESKPLVVELACGRGEYSVGLAEKYKEKNFIGVDIKGDRMWKGCQAARDKGLTNVGFLRTMIQNIEQFFAPEELSEIWITFPDPRPKKNDARRRLTHPRFQEMYRKLVSTQNLIHLKTDNLGLFEYTLEVLQQQPIQNLRYTYDLSQSEMLHWHEGIQTRYEKIFSAKGFKINYLQYSFQKDSSDSFPAPLLSE
ncbi:MAG: tRNA (guanosine(46)-N7)-methyltransferase TrmB [Cytophagales bacterium]|nr:MAG: tRNA (guanosine(46)-N7)-methyltransferase TrmB [Cytophagales bacterium]